MFPVSGYLPYPPMSPPGAVYWSYPAQSPQSFASSDHQTSPTLRTPPSDADEAEFEAFCATFRPVMKGRGEGSNANMRRLVRKSSEVQEDEAYRAKRARNNEAAKRSRDTRKGRELDLMLRVAFLEYKNAKLRARINARQACVRCGGGVCKRP